MTKFNLTANQKNTLKKYSREYKSSYLSEANDYSAADRLIAAINMAFSLDADDTNTIQLLSGGRWSVYFGERLGCCYIEGDGETIICYSLSSKFNFDECLG